MLRKIVLVLTLLATATSLPAQDTKTKWVDSLFQSLNLVQKVEQLFMIPVDGSPKVLEGAIAKIKSQQPGGIVITKGSLATQPILINRVQELSKIPLLVGMNAEWGLGQTLDSAMSFHSPVVQSAWSNDSLNVELGARIARQLRIVGVHINFGPRLDLYDNQPDYTNYYSNSIERLAVKSSAFVKGLQDNGIIACAKLTSDKIPLVNDTTMVIEANRIDVLPLQLPLRLISQGVKGLMTTHYNFSVYSSSSKKKAAPASSSSLFITDMLQKKIGFEGLTFTDIPYLNTLVTKKKKGEIEAMAFMIGNDVLINPQNPTAAIKVIRKAIKKNPSLQAQLDRSVRKILAAKFDAGLALTRRIRTDSLYDRLHTAGDLLFHHHLAEASVTVVRNYSETIPITSLENKRFVSLSLGQDDKNEFNHFLSFYAPFRTFSVLSSADLPIVSHALDAGDVVIVSVYQRAAAIQKEVAQMLLTIPEGKQVIVCQFGNPYPGLDWKNLPVVIAGYEEMGMLPKIAAQIIFGGMGAHGVLPGNVSDSLLAGQGRLTTTHDRLSYTLPEAAGMDSKTLEGIRAIAQEGIDSKAFPGCRVFVVKNEKVVYDKSFGYLTYDKTAPVTDETLYDLASLTKVSATLQTVMFMVEKGLIDINKKVSFYLPELRNSNKKDFIIKDILTHQAGLWPFLPFWAQTMKDSLHLPEYYSHEASPDFPFPVSPNLFATKAMKDSLWQWIIQAKVVEKSSRTPYDYRYSDMGFYIMQHLAERILNQPMDEFLQQNIYEPLGAYTTGYQPLNRFPASRIAPTEDDKLFRKSLLIGYVHDQGAAMHGGIAGHAGLFSTANDLAKLGQMWLQKGTYGGERYFKPQTLDLFTGKQYETSRRGLGWDKPVPGDSAGPTSIYASPRTFGHTGFTGTCIWVDPDYGLIYVFLSNRVYPEMTNNKILNANIRPRIQDLLYKAIFNYYGSPR